MVKIIILIVTLFFMTTKPIYTTYDEAILVEEKFTALKSEYIPSQTEILSVQWSEAALTIDVSSDITSYGGGNAMEYAILCELLEMVFSIPQVESFTLLIEGQASYLPEGSQILNYTRERYNEDNYFRNAK